MTAGGADSAPAPGWYPGPAGKMWWWDGDRWVAPLPVQPIDPSLAVLPHLGFFVMPVFAALALRLTLGKRDTFQRHHATEALNAQIWFGVVWNAVGLPFYIHAITSGPPDPGTFVGVWLTMAGLLVAIAILSVIGALKASRRAWWRYPLIPHRFVRGEAAEARNP